MILDPPLSVSAPAAEMSTVVDVPFTILIASPLQIYVVICDDEPFATLTVPPVEVVADAMPMVPFVVMSRPKVIVAAPVLFPSSRTDDAWISVVPPLIVVVPALVEPTSIVFDVVPVPILIAPVLVVNVPMFSAPPDCVVAMSICDATFEASILLTVRVLLIFVVPDTSKLYVGV